MRSMMGQSLRSRLRPEASSLSRGNSSLVWNQSDGLSHLLAHRRRVRRQKSIRIGNTRGIEGCCLAMVYRRFLPPQSHRRIPLCQRMLRPSYSLWNLLHLSRDTILEIPADPRLSRRPIYCRRVLLAHEPVVGCCNWEVRRRRERRRCPPLELPAPLNRGFVLPF